MVNKEENKCSLFEEMLMWTSYRYCIGRKTYVTSLAGEMAQHYYNKLTDERMEFTAMDIRKEIMDHLRFLPCEFSIDRMYNDDELNPIDVLMEFIQKENINSEEEFFCYSTIRYNSHTNTYEFEKKTPTIKSYFSIYDIEELIPWSDLASCFNKKGHKLITFEYNGKTETHRCFKSWVRKVVPCEDKPGYYISAKFGWESVWVDVDEFVKLGHINHYINNDYIKEIKDAE